MALTFRKFITLKLSFKMSCSSSNFLGHQCFPVYDTVSPPHFRVFISNLYLCHEPFNAACHSCSKVSTDTGAEFRVQTVFTEGCINNIKNVLSSCLPFQSLVEKYMFTNVIRINVFHESNKLCISTDICQYKKRIHHLFSQLDHLFLFTSIL